MATTTRQLRLGTRGSLLAQVQSRMVAAELELAHPGLAVELIIIRTTGDAIADRPLHEVGGKGLFTKELEQQILSGAIDFAVHSYKDVPVTMPLVDQSNLVIAATPNARTRGICSSRNRLRASISYRSVQKSAPAASPWRSQLLALRPDLQVEPVRGNVDTRLKKVAPVSFKRLCWPWRECGGRRFLTRR